MNKKLKSARWIFFFLGFMLLISVGLVAGVMLLNQSQDNRQQASNDEQIVTITVTTDDPLVPNTTATLQLKARDLNQSALNGFQVVLDLNFSTEVPNDMQFSQTVIAGMQAAGTALTDKAGGKHLTVGFLTTDPTLPISLGGEQALGTITFTVPTSGELSIGFDDLLTRVIQNVSGADIAKTSTSQTITFRQIETTAPVVIEPPTIPVIVETPSTPVVVVPPTNSNIGGESLDVLDRAIELEAEAQENETQALAIAQTFALGTGGGNPSVAATTGRTVLAQTTTKPQTLTQPQAAAQPELPSELPESGFDSALLVGIGGLFLILSGSGLWLKMQSHSKM